MEEIRVRFAPSPTGYLHVGGARTALFNWLFARNAGGKFILRIEDTDADRSRPELTTAILESLEWLGLHWDEGPYHQSERLDLYRGRAQELERLGHAYPCFCTTEELDARRRQAEQERRAWKYDGTCRDLSTEEREKRKGANLPFALRFRIPPGGKTSFDDIVFGRVEIENSEIEDFVLLRSGGQPTYHMGVVTDDADMRITHVVRGADHLTNTFKQILMYRALSVPLPTFAHLPLILGPDRHRLSKRHGATAVGAYRDQGILPEAMANFLALLGWTPPEGKEIVPLAEMVRQFDLAAVSKSNAVFDPEKLVWMNSEYLRHLDQSDLLPRVAEELKTAGLWRDEFAAAESARIGKSVQMLQTRARTLKDFSDSGRAFFTDDFDYQPQARAKFWKDAALAGWLEELSARLKPLGTFDPANTEKCLRALAEEKGIKAGVLINASRVALTGQAVAPGLFDVMTVLGRDRVVERLHKAAAEIRK